MPRSYDATQQNTDSTLPSVNFDVDLTKRADSNKLNDASRKSHATASETPDLPNVRIIDGHSDDWIKGVSTSQDGRVRTVTFSDGTVGTYTDGALTERQHPGGGKDVYQYKNGALVEMDRADGKVLKWESGSYQLYDSKGKSLGQQRFEVCTGAKEGYEVSNRPVSASELGDPSRSNAADQAGSDEDVVKVNTVEPSKTKSLDLLHALVDKDSKTANDLLQEFEKQGMQKEDIAAAYRNYTGRSLNDDMKRAINSSYVEAPPDEVSESQSSLQHLFTKIDRNGNGTLSDDELSRAMGDNTIKGQDAVTLAGLRQSYLENNGYILQRPLTKDAVNEFETAQAAKVAADNMAQIDVNHDGRIDSTELTNFAAKQDGPQDSRLDLRLIEAMWNKPQGLSRNDLDVLIANGKNPIGEAANFTNQTNQEKSLYGNNADALQSIRSENFGQGDVGDCHLMSTLSSMSSNDQGREIIKNMITANGDGTYTVTFPGASQEPVTVNKPTEAEQALYARTKVEGTGYWAAVVEKAYGEYVSRSVMRRNIMSIPNSDVQQENAGTGAMSILGGDAATINLLTGTKSDNKSFSSLTDNQVEALVSKSRANGTPMIMGRGPGWSDLLSDPDPNVTPPGRHYYAIVDYDPATKMVTVMNPWNSGAKYGGKFQMPISKLKDEFSDIAYNEK